MKPQEYRRVAKQLRRLGCSARPGKGDHEVWTCGCGLEYRAVLTRPGTISPGVMTDVVKKLACLPEGWWSK